MVRRSVACSLNGIQSTLDSIEREVEIGKCHGMLGKKYCMAKGELKP